MNKPIIIDGPPYGTTEIDVEYDFTFNTTDPEGEDVYYYVDWGDETYDDWFGPFESGQNVEASHSWDKSGDYEVKVKDIHGAESVESDPWLVHIPSLEKKTYYFDEHHDWILWERNWKDMVDGDPGTAASTTNNKPIDIQRNTGNTCDGFNHGPIEYVYANVTAKTSYLNSFMKFIPGFNNGQTWGEEYPFTVTTTKDSYILDITNDTEGPGYEEWEWDDIEDLDCEIIAILIDDPWYINYAVYCYHVEIIVDYYE